MELSTKEFAHHQAAHCESGVTSNLLRYADIPISEAMAFGIGSGLFFIHLPMAKVMGLPLTSYRSFPGGIFKKTCRRLKIPFGYETFRKPSQGARALEQHLDAQRPVGLRSNIYWLPYIPRPFRFQFNAHNLVVYGRGEPEQYLVSDPILEAISVCPASSLNKARFSKGILAPKGLIFYPRAPAVPLKLPMAQAIEKGIRETVHRMLFAPVSFVGVKGIRYLSRQMRRWPARLPDLATQKLYMANVVRMQEEIGTGGAGFRFLYAAFLQEAGESLGQPTLLEAARQMTEVGNVWREFATLAAKFCKDRLEQPYEVLPDLLLEIADREEAIYRNLRRNYL